MDSGVRALASGCLAFVVVTTAVRSFKKDGNRIDALRLGGSVGGAVALGVWITARWTAAASDDGTRSAGQKTGNRGRGGGR